MISTNFLCVWENTYPTNFLFALFFDDVLQGTTALFVFLPPADSQRRLTILNVGHSTECRLTPNRTDRSHHHAKR